MGVGGAVLAAAKQGSDSHKRKQKLKIIMPRKIHILLPINKNTLFLLPTLINLQGQHPISDQEVF